ncbi:putative membrane protein [Hasllibacter halocynthiae]|uniref:Putative membrane protein n=1 Tax=Hasllibacter halocynthiae TaxID=595589 RepID=A0A2T0X9S3_9RHOB|nr:TIGR01620 family protein [Hasllibacter halocynthiae]PRY95673.1 putative membrane protein [Hasllibacter halocynthiae]
MSEGKRRGPVRLDLGRGAPKEHGEAAAPPGREGAAAPPGREDPSAGDPIAAPPADTASRAGAAPPVGGTAKDGPAARRRGPLATSVESSLPSPADAPAIEDAPAPAPEGAAMRTLAAMAARRGGRPGLGVWALRLGLGLVLLWAGVAFWDFADRLVARNEVLGWTALGLLVAFLAVLGAMAWREWRGFRRLARLDRLQHAALRAAADGEAGEARAVSEGVLALYRGRPELAEGLRRAEARLSEVLDADAALAIAGRVLEPLDEAAKREVEAAARQVATVTAVVPLALADVAAALFGNLRMIRRVAEIYGGRSGGLSAWRLTRTVLGHLVATGAVAVGDDLIHSVAGGGLLSRVSRRFGEGVVNGALTARVGVAAMEVCRPLPFARRPSVTGLVQRALRGLFAGRGSDRTGGEAP